MRKGSPSLRGDAPTGSFASKHGCHIIGHVDDYSTLKQQILEGKMLVHKMASLMRPALSVPSLEAQGTEVIPLCKGVGVGVGCYASGPYNAPLSPLRVKERVVGASCQPAVMLLPGWGQLLLGEDGWL